MTETTTRGLGLALLALVAAAPAVCAAQDADSDKTLVYSTECHFAGIDGKYALDAFSDGEICVRAWAGTEGYDLRFLCDYQDLSFSWAPGYEASSSFVSIPRNDAEIAYVAVGKGKLEGYANDLTYWIDFKDARKNIEYTLVWKDPTAFRPDPSSPVVYRSMGEWKFDNSMFDRFSLEAPIEKHEDGSFKVYGFFGVDDYDLEFWVNSFGEVVFPTRFDAGVEYTYLDYGPADSDYLLVRTGKLGDCYAVYDENTLTRECRISLYENYWTQVGKQGSFMHFVWKDTTGVSTLPGEADPGASSEARYYDLQGRPLAAPSGLCIERRGARVSKILR